MENISVNLVAIIGLLAVNGFFVAAEFALVKARGFRIETLANEGSATARLTLRIQQNLEAYLATCQLGITMASLGLGWVGEPAVAALLEPLFHSLGVPDAILHAAAFTIGFLLFVSLYIVLGEQVPKILAIRKAEPVALWVAYPLHVCYSIVSPLNGLLNATTRTILSLFKVAEATHTDVNSNDELKALLSTSEEHGKLTTDNAEMLRNMFEFDQRHVRRVMIPFASLKILDINADTDENLAIIRDSGHSHFPLINRENNEEIIGIVLVKDLYAAMLNSESKPWADIRKYCREPLIVPEAQKIFGLFDIMRSEHAHMALVVGEYGELVGVVTFEDLLEEIVGDIVDETDSISPSYEITQLAEGRWEADGLVSLSAAQRTIGLIVPDDMDVNTLSELCVTIMGKMPEVGDAMTQYGHHFIIQGMGNHRVSKLLIQKLDLPDIRQNNSEGFADEQSPLLISK